MAFSILRTLRPLRNLADKTKCFSSIAATRITTRQPEIPQNELRYLRILTKESGSRASTIRNYGKHVRNAEEKQQGYSSLSESGTEDEHVKRPRAESEFWRRKMRTIHSLLDVNKDGVISYDDFKLLAEKFVNLGHMDKQQTNDFRKCMQDLWEAQWGEINPYNLVTVEQYLEDMHHVLNDKQLKKKVHAFLPYLFKAVDKDKSGEISVEEFKLFFECVGIDEAHAVASFSMIDTNNDGKLSIKEFIKHGREYFLSEDEQSISKLFWGPLVDH